MEQDGASGDDNSAQAWQTRQRIGWRSTCLLSLVSCACKQGKGLNVIHAKLTFSEADSPFALIALEKTLRCKSNPEAFFHSRAPLEAIEQIQRKVALGRYGVQRFGGEPYLPMSLPAL
jgi:hypothetical protein